eukprot:5583956-Alexandrium_andersonii.AAC.1
MCIRDRSISAQPKHRATSPWNAFLAAHPSFGNAKLLSQQWSAMTAREKQPYVDAALGSTLARSDAASSSLGEGVQLSASLNRNQLK